MSLGNPDIAAGYAAPVVATVEMLYQSGIDREDLILYDDAVLALAGIKRADEARFIVEPTVFKTLQEERETPRWGHELRAYRDRGAPMENHLHTVSLLDRGCLPVDLTTYVRGNRQERFRELHAMADYSSRLGIAHFSLEQTLYDKSHSGWLPNRLDAFRIARHMGKSPVEAAQLAAGIGKSAHRKRVLI